MQNVKLLRRALEGKEGEGMQRQSVTTNNDLVYVPPRSYLLISRAHTVIFCADLYIRGRRGVVGRAKETTDHAPTLTTTGGRL